MLKSNFALSSQSNILSNEDVPNNSKIYSLSLILIKIISQLLLLLALTRYFFEFIKVF